MLAGTVYFLNEFNRAILELDIEDMPKSKEKLFELILSTGAEKVVVGGVCTNHQIEEYESVIFLWRY